MVWYVVKFPKENSFEVVPKAWYIESSSECFWPPATYKTEKILKLIENSDEPAADWKIHPSKRLGTYSDLNEAKKKAQKALATSDISSCNEEALNRKRKKRKNPKFYSDSEPDSEESDDNSYPAFKKGFSIRNISLDRKMQSLKRYRSRSYSPPARDNFNYSDINISPTNNEEKSQKRSGGDISMQIASTSFNRKSPSINLQYSCSDYNLNMLGNNSFQTPRHQKETDVRNTIAPTLTTPRQQKETVNVAGDNDFKKIVLSELSHLHLKLNAIAENVCSLVALYKTNAGNLPSTSSIDDITSLNKRLPIKSIEELNEFESWLGDEKNYKLMVNEFKRIGGQSMQQTVRRILYRVLTNGVANLYSWDGAKKKSPLKYLLLARGILDVVKTQYTNSTENDIIDTIRVWMVKAKERMKNEKHNENQEPIPD